MILVLGAGGTVGSALVRRAGRVGKEPVLGLYRSVPPRLEPGMEHVELQLGDCRHPRFGLPPKVWERVQATTTSIHFAVGSVGLAATASKLRREHLDPLENALALATTCANLGAFVYVSSTLAVGACDERCSADDLPSSVRFRNLYELTKHEAERRVRASELPWRVIRPGQVLDASDGTAHSDQDLGLATVLRLVTSSGVVTTGGATPYWLSPLDLVADLALAIAEPGAPVTSSYAVDPSSPTFDEIITCITARYRHAVRLIPARLAAPVLQLIPWRRWGSAGVDALAQYVGAEWHLDLSNQTALQRWASIESPADRTYLTSTLDRAHDRLAGCR